MEHLDRCLKKVYVETQNETQMPKKVEPQSRKDKGAGCTRVARGFRVEVQGAVLHGGGEGS